MVQQSRLSDLDLIEELYRRGLSEDERSAALRFRWFAKNQLGIDMHVGQVAFGGLVLARREDGWSAKYLTLLLAAGNRAGKTMLLAALIIYSCLGKLSRPRPDEGNTKSVERWGTTEYHWYHFGISQEVADLVFNDIVRILSGLHESQINGCPISANAPIAAWDTKEYGDYRWVRFVPEVGGAQVHFRTTGEKALGSLGKDMHGLSFDEAGIERNLDFLVAEVFNLRRLGTGGQFLMVSTPSEMIGLMFADQWDKGDPHNPDRYQSYRSLRMSTRDNIGYGLTQDMFDRLVADMDERTIRQNIDGEFLQGRAAYFNGHNVDRCFVSGIPEESIAKERMVYLQGVDPAKAQDSAWSIALALVPNPDDPDSPFLVGVRAKAKHGQKSVDTIVSLAVETFNSYEVARLQSRCYTAIDATGFGGKLFRELLEREIPSLYNIEFGGTVQKKRKLLGDLRTIIDSGRLLLPREGIWLAVRRQLLGYKLEDRDIEQDAVMALVCAVALLRRTPVESAETAAFDWYQTRPKREDNWR
jgi:hypothetical protein